MIWLRLCVNNMCAEMSFYYTICEHDHYQHDHVTNMWICDRDNYEFVPLMDDIVHACDLIDNIVIE